jgi:hypothetical protein
VEDKVVVLTIRHREQFKPDVVRNVLGKVIQSNARFDLTDRLEVHLDHARLPAGNGRGAEKTKGRTLDVLSAIKEYRCGESRFSVLRINNCYGSGKW